MMVIGVDVVNEGRHSIIGFCASTNRRMTKYFNTYAFQKLDKEHLDHKDTTTEQKDLIYEKFAEERTYILISMIKQALTHYAKGNKGSLPAKIVIYRDGVGGPIMQSHCKTIEIGPILKEISGMEESYSPEILYITVNKKTSHRLFLKDGDNILNPGPGTVLDSVLVDNDGEDLFDFFMIPHKATVATAMPVHFTVLHNSTKLSKLEVETLTFNQCYQYFGFVGGIKVPAPVMYAHKFANYVHENKIQFDPTPALQTKPHFL